MSLKLNVYTAVYTICSGSTLFKCNCLCGSLSLTVLCVVYTTVWLSSGKAMVLTLHVDLVSCQGLVLYTPEVGSRTHTYVRMLDILWLGANFL